MAKAYKCDRCGKVYEGISSIELKISGVLRAAIELTFSPNCEDAPEYPKDLCKTCCDEFVKFWQGGLK